MLHANLDCLTIDADFVRFYGLEGWQLGRGARLDIKPRAMPRTFDLFAVQLTLIERAAIMGAQVVNRVELTAQIADRDLVVANVEHGNPFGRNV